MIKYNPYKDDKIHKDKDIVNLNKKKHCKNLRIILLILICINICLHIIKNHNRGE